MTTLLARVRALRADLDSALLERAEAVLGLVLALLSRQHVLLLGPPGTAKSLLTRETLARVTGAKGFERLLTRFSEPSELFGPPSLPALEAGRSERVVGGMLPEAHLAFLDEIFKSNSSILNSLLGILNERTFANGGAAPVRCPLVTVVAASNELPQGDDLSALWDRFPLRFFVGYLAEESSFRALLTRSTSAPTATLSLADLQAAQAEVAALPLAPAAVDAIVALREALAAEGISASDRRWRESLAILRAHAWLAGRARVEVADLEPLAHVLWAQPEDRAKVRGRVLGLAAPAYARALEILDAALPARSEALKVKGRTPADLAAVTAALRRLSDARAEVEALASTQGDSPDLRVAEVAVRLKDAAVEVIRHLTGAKPVGAAR